MVQYTEHANMFHTLLPVSARAFFRCCPHFSLTVSAVHVYAQVDCTVCRPVCFLCYLDTIAACVCECVC